MAQAQQLSSSTYPDALTLKPVRHLVVEGHGVLHTPLTSTCDPVQELHLLLLLAYHELLVSEQQFAILSASVP